MKCLLWEGGGKIGHPKINNIFKGGIKISRVVGKGMRSKIPRVTAAETESKKGWEGKGAEFYYILYILKSTKLPKLQKVQSFQTKRT